MIHPSTKVQYINDQIGWGVFATDFIPMGTIIYIKDELEITITPEVFRKMDPVLQDAVEKYSYIENQGNRIISWDHAKYVNHCCDCNTMSTGYGFEIAIRDIFPDEEITDEYGLFNVSENMALQCNKPNCRQILKTNDMDAYFENWDKKVRNALPRILDVSQPLFHLLDTKTLEQIVDFLADQNSYVSIRSLKFDKKKK